MPIDRIEVVQLPVGDLRRATDFYRRVLATHPHADTDDVPGGAAVFGLQAGGPDLYLQRPPAPYARPNESIVALHASAGTDAGTLLTEIAAAGGMITYRESANPDLLVVGFTDTEGNHLELLVTR